MKHKGKTRNFGRSKSHNKALMRNLCRSLILLSEIETTQAKAKELKIYTEKLISKCKRNVDYLKNKAILNWTSADIVPKLGKLAEKYQERQGGYVQIIKVNSKRRDTASMAKIKLV
jgi:large subunit ribosomal protein L17